VVGKKKTVEKWRRQQEKAQQEGCESRHHQTEGGEVSEKGRGPPVPKEHQLTMASRQVHAN